MSIAIRLPSGDQVSVEVEPIIIGTDESCHISLPAEAALQPRHVRIRRVANRWLIETLGQWEVRVGNETSVRMAWLRPGDVIHLAKGGPCIVFQPSVGATSGTTTAGQQHDSDTQEGSSVPTGETEASTPLQLMVDRPAGLEASGLQAERAGSRPLSSDEQPLLSSQAARPVGASAYADAQPSSEFNDFLNAVSQDSTSDTKSDGTGPVAKGSAAQGGSQPRLANTKRKTMPAITIIGICGGSALLFAFCCGGAALIGLTKQQSSPRAESSSAAAHLTPPDEVDFSALDYSKGPEGQPLITRDVEDREGQDTYKITEQGYLSHDAFVKHGTRVTWYERPSGESQGRKWVTALYFRDERHGPVTAWHENGALRHRWTRVHGARSGASEEWYDNGQLRTRGTFRGDKEVGLWEVWHDNGTKLRESTYVDGKLSGILRSWYKSGVLNKEETLDNGINNGRFRTWWENGQPNVDGNFVRGVRDGSWTVVFYNTGSPRYTLRFSSGRLQRSTRAEFIAALAIVTHSRDCRPERGTFHVAGHFNREFFAAFGPPLREIEVGHDAYHATWVYSCSDGDLQMESATTMSETNRWPQRGMNLIRLDARGYL